MNPIYSIQWHRHIRDVHFLPRDALHSAVSAVVRYLPVRPSISLSHAGIVSKRLNLYLKTFWSSSGSPIIMRRSAIRSGIPAAIAQNTRGWNFSSNFRL